MLKNYFKIAWRNLISQKSSSFINITGLFLGMAAAVLILFWVQNELNFDNYHTAAERIYHVGMGHAYGKDKFGGTPFLLAESIEKEIPSVEKVAAIMIANNATSPVLGIGGNFFREKDLVFAGKEWFQLFHYDFVDGNASAFSDQPHGMIITESLAKKYYGHSNAVGEIIYIDSNQYQVRGVIRDNPVNSSFQFNIFLPLKALPGLASPFTQSWTNFTVQTFIRVKENAVIGKVQNDISHIFLHQEQLRTLAQTGEKKDPIVALATALAKMHFDESAAMAQFHTGDKKTVLIFSVLGLLLLVTASINYVNLSTAKASIRSKEVSIKKIMGAHTKSLFAQFMAESVMTSLAALLLTLVLVRLSLPWFNRLTEKTFTLSFISSSLWQVLAGTLLMTILMTGIYPALLLSSFKPLNVLRGMNILRVKHSSLRKILVITQFTIAIALSVCTIVILQQLKFIQSNNEGYNRSQVFSVSIPSSWSATHKGINKSELVKTLKNELSKETSIDHITVSMDAIQNIKMSMGGIADWAGKQPGQQPMITLLPVDADFRNIFHLQLKEGRWFQQENALDRHNYILSETSVTELGLKQPIIGQYFALLGDTGTIIGIVKDFHFRDYHQKISAAVLTGNPDLKRTFFIEASPANMKQALSTTAATWKTFFPQTPFEYNFMDAEFEQMYRADTKTAVLVSVFSGIALFISCLGLFGLVSFVAAQRTKEIGIRKVLGAGTGAIAVLLSKDFMRLILLSVIIASPIAWWSMHTWLETFVYRIDLRWWMFAASAIAAITIALLTMGIRAVKAAMANPASSLRTE